MQTISTTIKQKRIGTKIEIWVYFVKMDSFGKEYKTKKYFDYCYKHENRRLSELLSQADNLYGFNAFNVNSVF